MSKFSQTPDVIAITWERHRRFQGICATLELPLFELLYGGNAFLRYLVLSWRTGWLLLRRRPRVLLVQNPSIVLTLLATMLRWLFRYRLVVDAHNEAVQPFIHGGRVINGIARLLLARADITIVTNSKLAGVVAQCGGHALILPDSLPLPPVVPTERRPDDSAFEVMVVSTYAPDEPIAEILAAAAALGGSFQFHVTGNDRKLAPDLRASLPGNVKLTGFLPEHDYWLLMARCHLVLDLTLMPDCLVCGAYEALSLRKPMVLSDNLASRELFGEMAEFAGGGASAIGKTLLTARERYGEFQRVAPAAKERFERQWRANAAALLTAMQGT